MHRSSSRLPLLLAGAGVATVAGLLAAYTWFADAQPVPVADAAQAVAAATTAAQPAPGIVGDRTAMAPRVGCLGAPVGSTFRYRLGDRTDVSVVSAEGGAQPGGQMHVEGFVTTTVLDRRDGEVLVKQQLDGVQFVAADGKPFIDDPVAAAFGAAAATPVLVRLDARGKVLGFGFDDGLDGDQRNFLRGTIGVLLFQAPVDDRPVWSVTDTDTTGDYDARYELLPAPGDAAVAVRRTRHHYLAVAGHDTPPEHELHGCGEATFSLELGWLVAATLDEGMAMALPLLDVKAVTARRAAVELVAADRVSPDADLAADWARATAPASGAGETVGRFAADSERRRWQKRLAGTTLDQLLAELSGLLARSDVDHEATNDAFQRLQWLSRLDDETTKAIAERIATRQLQGDLAGIALSSLGAAGTPPAQSVLASVRSDRSLSADVRQAATIATLQLSEPSPELIQGLYRDAGGDFDGRGNAMLVLGGLAPRAGKLADGRTAVEALVAMEADALARGDLSTWLLAIGNAVPPQTVAIVQRHIDDADPAVRASACVALRRVADPIVVTLLVDHGMADQVATVRREAMTILGARSEPAARAAIEHAAAADPDEELRYKAEQLLRPRD